MHDPLHSVSPWVSFVLSVAIVLAAAELGRLIGANWRRRHPEAMPPDMLALEGAALGLLALMIGFTFAMALSRFDDREIARIDEANAIGATALRARLLPEPQASEVRALLRDYVRLRLEVSRETPGAAALNEAIHGSNDLQAKLWERAVSVSAANSQSVPSQLFVEALSRMVDLQETRLAARERVPPVVFVLLYGIAAVAIGFSGYVGGAGDRRGRLPVAIMAVLIASVIVTVDDIDRSRSGFAPVSQQAMQNLNARLER